MNRLWWAALGIAAAAIVLVTQIPTGATMQTREDHAAAQRRIHADYREARTQCGDLGRDDRDLCAARALAAVRRANAAADVNYRGTVDSKADRRIAEAESDLLARVACATTPFRETNTCVARAANIGPAAGAAAIALK